MIDALHVTNGDCTVPGLRGTGLAERILTWRDVLHEGPVPDVADDELRRLRAAFLDGDGALAELEERDAVLDANRDGTYVLWFEADLYDQLQIVQVLSRLAALGIAPQRITLICIGEHLGIARFGGLGELDAAQLAALPAVAGTTLSAAALEHATAAWAALRAPEPSGVNAIAASRSPELRFVAEAFDRIAREYPSTRDGLSLTERRLLAAVADGAATREQAFARAAAREARPFLGDTWAFDALDRMAGAGVPLLDAELRLTTAGHDVLRGDRDHVVLNGVDRWVGGVHLTGHEPPWRFDEGLERIT